ncbi:MAG: hypothetical protein BroJett025_06320 [Patescibacteria group bacterium]|nr:MAG: hypothetical protein BroJett025_06320 [Patescibacteria group bacterium]
MNKSTTSVFSVDQLEFPYLYKFPGQNSDEVILYVTREHKVMLYVRLAVVLLISIILVVVGYTITGAVGSMLTSFPAAGINLFITGLSALVLFVGYWWVNNLWKKSLAFVTNKRLTKIIYTTPFNRHTLSLPLEMIVDTGSYDKGFIQAILKLGTFTARSSASSSGVATDDTGRINKKYFYIENVSMVEDLQHYVAKVLSAFRKNPDSLATFRPFIPHMKGAVREEFMKQYPEYWS